MKKLQAYDRPEMVVVEIAGKDGVMLEIHSEGGDGQLSRRGDSYDDNENAAARHQRTVWDEDEEQ